MKSFLETLAERKYDLSAEVNAIEDLIRRRNCFGTSILLSFKQQFLDWPRRNNFIDFDTFLIENKLDEIIEWCAIGEEISVDHYTYYAEFVVNMILFVDNKNEIVYSKHIIDNVNNVLRQLNYTFHFDDNKDVHIVPDDVLVSEAAEITQDTYGLGESIYAYNYRQLSGDLNAKSDILCRLYKYYETIESQAKQYGFNALADDVSHLSNKLNVRHAASPKQKIVLGDMTQKEIEEWYDDLFRLYLSLIVLVDYKSKRKDINELKAKLG